MEKSYTEGIVGGGDLSLPPRQTEKSPHALENRPPSRGPREMAGKQRDRRGRLTRPEFSEACANKDGYCVIPSSRTSDRRTIDGSAIFGRQSLNISRSLRAKGSQNVRGVGGEAHPSDVIAEPETKDFLVNNLVQADAARRSGHRGSVLDRPLQLRPHLCRVLRQNV